MNKGLSEEVEFENRRIGSESDANVSDSADRFRDMSCEIPQYCATFD